MDRERRFDQATVLGDHLAGLGVRAIALTWVDNAGITRVKAVPLARFAHAAAWGVGMSPIFDVFLVDDSITTSAHVGGPAGDLRLYPDLDRVCRLAAQPGWAWAPVDRLTQDGEPYACCQRTLAGSAAQRAAQAGLRLRMAIEVEWFLGTESASGAEVTPAVQGPAYGMTRLLALSRYADELLGALDAQGVAVEQFHPEYAAGQLEISVAAADPVLAADRTVLVRQTIQAVSLAHGLRASFAPVVVPDQVGNGQHLHLSAELHGRPLLHGGDGRYGLTAPGESLLAGVLHRLPALSAITAPSVASHIRLVPQRWAAPYQCWGLENREAALRMVTGSVGERNRAANAELKCCDGSANPYLSVAAVTAIAATAIGEGRRLPPEVPGDPALLPPDRQPPRLPRDVGEAVAALRADDILPALLGEPLLEAFCAVRLAEAELYADATPEAIAEATRWRY